jgi:hypothetical protein
MGCRLCRGTPVQRHSKRPRQTGTTVLELVAFLNFRDWRFAVVAKSDWGDHVRIAPERWYPPPRLCLRNWVDTRRTRERESSWPFGEPTIPPDEVGVRESGMGRRRGLERGREPREREERTRGAESDGCAQKERLHAPRRVRGVVQARRAIPEGDRAVAVDQTIVLRFFIGRTLTTLRAGLALKVVS